MGRATTIEISDGGMTGWAWALWSRHCYMYAHPPTWRQPCTLNPFSALAVYCFCEIRPIDLIVCMYRRNAALRVLFLFDTTDIHFSLVRKFQIKYMPQFYLVHFGGYTSCFKVLKFLTWILYSRFAAAPLIEVKCWSLVTSTTRHHWSLWPRKDQWFCAVLKY